MMTTRKPGDGLLRDEAAFRILKDAVVARTGHHYYDDKDDLLWEKLAKRLRAAGVRTVQDYLARLGSPVAGEAEWNALEAEITIGETFFFRFAEQFEALRRNILPAIIERNRETRRIRIWSAGCSTGAEAYSVAIVLRELLGDAIPEWSVGVVGTDINDDVLAAARQATYGKWTLRSMPAEDRARWFTAPGPDGPWTLKPAFRGLAHFERHNLVSLAEGASPLQFTGFDLILCRNVLIYFHADAVARIVTGLADCLAPEGWLLVGHAESSPAFVGALDAVELPGTMAFRPKGALRPDSAAPADVPTAPAPVVAPDRRIRPGPSRAGSAAERARRSAQPPLRPAPLPQSLDPAPAASASGAEALARLRETADRGDLEGGLALAARALAAEPANPALFYYRGLIGRAQDQAAEAEAAFRRAIYLDRSFVMAHYQLGLLLTGRGDLGGGRRALRNAAALAAALPADAELPEGDGMTAGALRTLARLTMSPVA
ncbi:CheR family methyltransferase [Alsobacter sp. SYSU BS001988]